MLSRWTIVAGRVWVLTLGRIAAATAVPQRDKDHNSSDRDRGRERGYREEQAVVGQYLDVRAGRHACAVGWSSALLPEGSLRLIRPAPQLRTAMSARVQNSTSRQPTVHSTIGVSGLRSR